MEDSNNSKQISQVACAHLLANMLANMVVNAFADTWGSISQQDVELTDDLLKMEGIDTSDESALDKIYEEIWDHMQHYLDDLIFDLKEKTTPEMAKFVEKMVLPPGLTLGS